MTLSCSAQLALLIDEKRSADVLALEMCNFAVVSRADYLAVVNEKHKTEVSERHLADGHVPNMRQLAPAHIPNIWQLAPAHLPHMAGGA